MAPDPVSDRPDRATDPNEQAAKTAELPPIEGTEAAEPPADAAERAEAAGEVESGEATYPTESAGRSEFPASPNVPDSPESPTSSDSSDSSESPGSSEPPESPGSPESPESPEPPDSPEPPESAEEIEPVPTLEVAGAGLRGTRGWVFRDVSLTARTGEITTLTGPSGAGRSTLLLACAGRLRLTEGSVAVHTHTPHRARVRDRVNVARIAGVIGLDPELSVTANVNDAADWARLRRSQARDLLATWRSRLDLALPSALPAGELDAPELTLLHLLCATLGDPRAIVLDDLDADLTIPQIAHVWKLTAQIAAGRVSAPTAVIVTTVAALPPTGGEIVRLDAPEGADA